MQVYGLAHCQLISKWPNICICICIALHQLTEVGPVQLMPPHWPHCGADPDPPAAVVVVDLAVEVVLVRSVVVVGLPAVEVTGFCSMSVPFSQPPSQESYREPKPLEVFLREHVNRVSDALAEESLPASSQHLFTYTHSLPKLTCNFSPNTYLVYGLRG